MINIQYSGIDFVYYIVFSLVSRTQKSQNEKIKFLGIFFVFHCSIGAYYVLIKICFLKYLINFREEFLIDPVDFFIYFKLN